jgi:hypothetical protein
LPSGSERDPVPFSFSANVKESSLKVESLFVYWPGTALTERLDSALELNKRAIVFAVMNIKVHHIPLEKEGVLERLLAPVIVSNPFPVLTGLTSNAQVPVITMVPEADVLDRIPEILAEGRVPEKAPVLIRGQ